MNRRGFLQSILAAGVAPYVSTAAGVLMPVRNIAVPEGLLVQMEKLHIKPTKLIIPSNFAAVLRPGLIKLFEAEFGALPA